MGMNGALCGHEGLDGVLCPVLQPSFCGGKAVVRASVRQDHGHCEGVQARAIGRAVPGAYWACIFLEEDVKEHILGAMISIFHTPMPAVVSELILG